MKHDDRGDGIQIAGYTAGQPFTVSLSVSSANITLPAGHYRLWASVNAFFRVDNAAQSATTASHPLTAGLDTLITIDSVNNALSAVVASGTGLLYISQLDAQSI